MRIAVILFLLVNPIQEFHTSLQRDTAWLPHYVHMQQDITRVADEHSEYFLMSHRNLGTARNVISSRDSSYMNEGPVIRNHSFTGQNYRQLPGQRDRGSEMLYAVLPRRLSFPETKRRLVERFLHRAGRKENELAFQEYSSENMSS